MALALLIARGIRRAPWRVCFAPGACSGALACRRWRRRRSSLGTLIAGLDPPAVGGDACGSGARLSLLRGPDSVARWSRSRTSSASLAGVGPAVPRPRPAAPPRRAPGCVHRRPAGVGVVVSPAQGAGLRGGAPAHRRCCGAPAVPRALLPPGLAARRAVHRRLDRRPSRSSSLGTIWLRLLRLQARRLLARSLVALQPLGERAALPPRLGRRRDRRPGGGRACAPPAPAAPASAESHAADDLDRAERPLVATLAAAPPPTSPCSATRRSSWRRQRRAARFPDVRRRGPELGRDGRPGRTAEASTRDLAWRFRELGDRHGGWTVFYQVSAEQSPALPRSRPQPAASSARRRACRCRLSPSRAAAARGCAQRTASVDERRAAASRSSRPPRSPTLLAELAGSPTRGSTRARHARKGVLARLLRRRLSPSRASRSPSSAATGRIVAFANLWLGGGHDELSIDLMRYRAGRATRA